MVYYEIAMHADSSDIMISQPASEEQKTNIDSDSPAAKPQYITSNWRETGLDSYSSTLPNHVRENIVLMASGDKLEVENPSCRPR